LRKRKNSYNILELNMEKGVLVIGGGIAGMQSALDLANSQYQVYLVERNPSIGGKMAQLDKTFPSMDCAI
jgi:heterodisulfide reductase subunit A2